MKHRITLTITSLLSILLFSFHWADELARGIEKGGISSVGGLFILGVWLYGTLALTERRSGLVIILLGALVASGVPVLHMQGAGLIGGRIIANSSGAFFWAWTLVALGATGLFSFVLSAQALWSSLRRSPAPRS